MKFSEWLDSKPSMSAVIKRELMIGSASLSNVRKGRTTMPLRWVPTVVRLSRGKLSYKSLVHEMLDCKRANGTLRGTLSEPNPSQL